MSRPRGSRGLRGSVLRPLSAHHSRHHPRDGYQNPLKRVTLGLGSVPCVVPCVLEVGSCPGVGQLIGSLYLGKVGINCKVPTYLPNVRYLPTVPNLVGGGSFVIPRPQPPLSHISPISFPPLHSTTPPSTHQIPSSSPSFLGVCLSGCLVRLLACLSTFCFPPNNNEA